MKRFLTFFLMAVFIFAQVAGTVSALSDEQLKIFQESIHYFNVDSCSTNPPASATNSGTTNNKMYVIGDSLTVGMRDSGNLKAKLTNGGWAVTDIEATGGISIDASIAKIKADSGKNVSSAGTVLVGLGTNRSPDPKKSINDMVSAIKDMSPNAQIIWINAYSTKTDYSDFNSTLNGLVDPGKKIDKVLDWAKEAKDNAGNYNLGADSLGIHTSPAGYIKRSEWVVGGVGQPSSGGAQSALKAVGTLNKDVGASEFTDAQGYRGDHLTGTYSYAELSPDGVAASDVSQQTATNLGKLDYKQRVAITYQGKTVVAEKLDIGKGGGPIEGKRRDIDLTFDKTAKALGITDPNNWSGVVHVQTVDNSTPLGESAASSGTPVLAPANTISCCPNAAGGSTTLTGKDDAEKVWNFFADPAKKLSNLQIAGIMGNLQIESGFSPTAMYPSTHGTDPTVSVAWGLGQWTDGKAVTIKKDSGVAGDITQLSTQLDMMWWELNNRSPTGQQHIVDNLRKITDLSEAVIFWQIQYEGSGVQGRDQRQAAAITWKNKVVGGAGANAAGTTDTTADPSNCGPDSSSITGYKNPYRDVKQQNPLRIDMGVDYAGVGPIYAIGNATVNVVHGRNGGSGWPGWGVDGGGGWVSYTLSDGPASGKTVYFAENCVPSVKAGDRVTPDTKICELDGLTTAWSESGWAADKSTTWAAAHVEWSGHDSSAYYTAYGENFSDLLVKLGQKPGTKQPGAQKIGTLPANWPQWK